MNSKTAIKQLKELEKKGKIMRLAAEAWTSDYQVLVSTILSARTRDEVTIPTAEKLFNKYSNFKKLASAKIKNVKKIL
jgi:endonuclease III